MGTGKFLQCSSCQPPSFYFLCVGGQDYFFYRSNDRLCSCCTTDNAIKEINVPIDEDLHLYKRTSESGPCGDHPCE